ncbi:MAG: hypothetical protein ACJ72B_01065 [Ornithinibacter sp.]
MPTPLPRRTALRSAAAAVVAAATAGVVASCSEPAGDPNALGAGAPGAGEDRPRGHHVTPGAETSANTLDPRTGGAPDATLAASRALLAAASIVVLSSGGERDLKAATAAARALGIPLLVFGPDVAAELDRLGTRTVVRWSGNAGAATPSAGGTTTPLPTTFGEREVVDAGDVGDLTDLPGLPLTPPRNRGTVLVLTGTSVPAGIEATLAAVGATRVTVTGTDPRTTKEARAALRAAADTAVLGIGTGLGPAQRFAQRVRTARHAAELPGGGLLPFPDRQMVALYGHPQTAALGMLGEQPAAEAVRRVRTLADEYQQLTDTTVVPAFELIATVAAGAAQKDGSYSRRTPVSVLLPWVEAAEGAGTYVVLDLQPGRDDFLTQAKAYEELLRRPWVGLALDPEWRLQPGEKPLRQIGHVDIDEVNAVGAWLAGLVRAHDLPPKVLTVHQFSRAMVRHRERLDTSLDEVQWLVHADGQGGQNAKQGTWSALKRDLPAGVWLGWKNFTDEDSPMLVPEQTIAQVHPTPQFVSYQ